MLRKISTPGFAALDTPSLFCSLADMPVKPKIWLNRHFTNTWSRECLVAVDFHLAITIIREAREMSEEVKEKVSPDPADPTVKVTDFDLIEIADLADQAKTLMFDVLEDFFEKYNPNEPADIKWIEWGFRCQRTKCRTVANLLWQIDKQLKEWGITV